MEAHDRLNLLLIRADGPNVDSAIAVVREHLAAGRMDAVDSAQFDEAATELRQHGTMTARVDRAWEMLRQRIVDPSIGESLSALDPVTARGPHRAAN